MKKLQQLVSLFLLAALLLTGCAAPAGQETLQTPSETLPPESTAPEATVPESTVPETTAPEANEPAQDGYNQVTFYWTYPGSYEKCDMWIWFGDQPGKGHLFQECEYGAKVVLDVPAEVKEVGFIVRRDCSEPGGSSWGSATKDFDQDRFAVVTGKETIIYLKSGDPAQYFSKDGGKTLFMAKKFTIAGMIDANTIEYQITPKATITDLSQVKVFNGDRQVAIESLSSLGKEATSGKIVLAENLDLSGNYRIEIEGYGEKAVVPTEIFDSKFFADNYHYNGKDLGAVINGEQTTFKVWAPTASKVVLNLFTAGDSVAAYKTVEMVKGDKGVWAHTEACGHGTYYTYTVTTSVGTQEAVDPYAKAAGLNGNRGMVVDLSRTNPEGWGEDNFATGIKTYSDAVIWEVHVRDFSNKIASSNYKGKYLAFTERGLVNEFGQSIGVDYLVNLGITHVHLLPVYDYATVDEANPDSQFNWGYDPKNYNVPEGSYSTNPYDGEVRIKEYKQMVQALHAAGIGVVMDMVYNHTYDANSSFNKIVPYYYYRYTATGANSSASGCGNDTASERYMFGKFMVDSVSYWAGEYDLDGFRFDLMGLHDLATMQEVENAVHAINPEAIIYGEGWTMGSTIDGSPMANQGQISKIEPLEGAIGGIAVFNDIIRDGLKGSVFTATSKGYISGNGNGSLPSVLFGIKGGAGNGFSWEVKNGMVVNYMSAHDNNTLWDKLILSNGDNTVEERLAMNRLGATLLMISKGTVFFQAGEEMLRTKDGDENSYKSSDAINNIDWSVLKEGSNEYEMMRYYQELIRVRQEYAIFRTLNTAVIANTSYGEGRVAITLDNHAGGKALIVSNPTGEAMTYNVSGNWHMIVNGVDVMDAPEAVTGSITVPAYTAVVFVNDACLNG